MRALPWKIDGDLSETAVLFEALCTICVMTFFFISGFFIYNKKGNIFYDWWKLIVNFFKTIFIPFFIIVILTLVFHDFFISKETIATCIQNFDIKVALDTLYKAFIVHYDVYELPGTAGHLWYVFSYALIILAYPATRFILKEIPKIFTYIILAIFLALMILNDYYLFYGSPIFNTLFQIIPKPIFYSMWGYVLYNDLLCPIIDKASISSSKNQKDKIIIINKPIFFISLVAYMIILFALFKTQCAYYLTTNGAYVYTSWLSTYAMLMTTCFVLIIYNINFDRFLGDSCKKAICYIAKRSLGIYLIHYLFVTKLLSIGFQSIFANNLDHLYQHFVYHIVYTLIIFVISFASVIVIENIVKLILPKEVRHG